MSKRDMMVGAGEIELKGQALYPRLVAWRAGQDQLTGDDLVAIYRFCEHWNAVCAANKKEDLAPIPDAPEMLEVVRATYPRLICTEEARPEWFHCNAENQYEPIKVIDTEIGRVLHRLGVKTEGWKKRVSDIAAALAPLCTIKGLTRRPSLIHWKERRAVDFEEVAPGAVGTVACKTKWYLLTRDGGFEGRPYHRNVFLLDRLPADPQDQEPTFTNTWIEERLGADQGQALWEWMAYLLSPGNTVGKRFHMWVGPKDTGKSTAVALLHTLLGEHNVSYQPAANLEESFVKGDIRGKLLNVSEEDSGYGHAFEKTVKRITGGTESNFEVKYGASGSDWPTYRLLFTTNNMPSTVDASGAFAGRMIVLSWNNAIQGKLAGIDAIDLKFKEELPGILWKCLHLRKVIMERRDLHVPEESSRVVAEIELESNTVAGWRKEATWLDPKAELSKEAIYEDYAAWCRRGNYKPHAVNAFWARFRDLDCWKTGAVVDGGRRRGMEGRPRLVRGLALGAQDQRLRTPDPVAGTEQGVPWVGS